MKQVNPYVHPLVHQSGCTLRYTLADVSVPRLMFFRAWRRLVKQDRMHLPDRNFGTPDQRYPTGERAARKVLNTPSQKSTGFPIQAALQALSTGGFLCLHKSPFDVCFAAAFTADAKAGANFKFFLHVHNRDEFLFAT